MIAIKVLLEAQKGILKTKGVRRRIRCFFSENNIEAYAQLSSIIAPYHKPDEGFEVKTYCGKFEDSIEEILRFLDGSFPLIFIDPKGWTGYPLDKIKPLFARPKCEVLVNFMYDHINRFAASTDENIVASLEPILGGPNWSQRLDPALTRGNAVEKLFRESLKKAGNFAFVVSTKIDKATVDRPHFFIAYGTKSREGLKVFRQIEYDALREHEKNRANAKEKLREEQSQMDDLFAGHQTQGGESTIDELVAEQKKLASTNLMVTLLKGEPLRFARVVDNLLQAHMVRETNVKDICIDLAIAGKIKMTWGGRNRKPNDDSVIEINVFSR